MLFCAVLLLTAPLHAKTLTTYQDEYGATIFSSKPMEGLEKVAETEYRTDLDWNINCNKDKFNHAKVCMLSKETLLVLLTDGQYAVSVGKRHYPKSNSAIKIDQHPTIYGVEGRITSPDQIIKQLKNGQKVFTRYQEWPYRHNQDNEIDLTDFPAKFAEMLEQYRKL